MPPEPARGGEAGRRNHRRRGRVGCLRRLEARVRGLVREEEAEPRAGRVDVVEADPARVVRDRASAGGRRGASVSTPSTRAKSPWPSTESARESSSATIRPRAASGGIGARSVPLPGFAVPRSMRVEETVRLEHDRGERDRSLLAACRESRAPRRRREAERRAAPVAGSARCLRSAPCARATRKRSCQPSSSAIAPAGTPRTVSWSGPPALAVRRRTGGHLAPSPRSSGNRSRLERRDEPGRARGPRAR